MELKTVLQYWILDLSLAGLSVAEVLSASSGCGFLPVSGSCRVLLPQAMGVRILPQTVGVS